MRVGTPLGEYRFEFRRLERRGRSIAIVGIVAGLESSLVIGPEDTGDLLKRAALPLGGLAAFLIYSRSR